ncbi:50S ribosomal protein L23 [bacterium]|nr:50S ribosomal protein L23 [bacterium]
MVVDNKENLARVLTQPRITEKATIGTGDNVYVFNVAPDSNKKQIKEAVKLIYNVDPVKVHVSKVATKKTRNVRDGIKGVRGGGKKAYVYLKKGDSISVM